MSGIDRGKITVNVNGTIYTNSSSPSLGFVGTLLNGMIVIPTVNYVDDSEIIVTLDVSDVSGNVSSKTYYFIVPDHTSPVIVELIPTEGASIDNPTTDIKIKIRDAISGIDLDTITVNVNGTIYTKNTPTSLNFSGSIFNGTIVIPAKNTPPKRGRTEET